MRKKLFIYLIVTYAVAFFACPPSILEARAESETVSLSQLWKK